MAVACEEMEQRAPASSDPCTIPRLVRGGMIDFNSIDFGDCEVANQGDDNDQEHRAYRHCGESQAAVQRCLGQVIAD